MRAVLRILAIASLFALLAAPGVGVARDYRGMMERIEAMLTDAAELYRSGDADGAKSKVQKAYFEVFENLEGPIRVNISAKKNFALEAEFAEIRRMIIRGDAVGDVEARIKSHMAEIWAVLPELESGFQLKAEPAAGEEEEKAEATAAEKRAAPQKVEPHWVEVTDRIGATLNEAARVYEGGDPEKARALITQAQFDGYKNSLLETVVRRYVSQAKDIEFNGEFRRILELVHDGKPARMVSASGAILVGEIKRVLPGLPLIEGTKVVETKPQETPKQDWRSVADNVLDEMGKAVALQRSGQIDKAIALIQDTYFDVFEGSGMEGAIGARDVALVTQLEAHFSKLMGLIKHSASPADLASAIAAMRTDFDEAVELLGSGEETPWALFLYSLIIILREGFEAILIITAITTYLVKTGNSDKLRVIYNAVIAALALSVLTAVLVKWVFNVSAASQEVLEGATMLLAAVVLFSMSYWLISKAEAERWMAYIKDTVDRSLTSGSLGALWFVSFLAVYREGAETVLFYEALTASASASAGAGITAIIVGFVVGCALLAIIYVAFRAGAMRLAIRPFFLATGALLYYMAFVFAGKGMLELIEGKVVEPTLISWLPEIPFLGIYPYWQTIAPQILLIVAALVAIAVLLLRSKPEKADQERPETAPTQKTIAAAP